MVVGSVSVWLCNWVLILVNVSVVLLYFKEWECGLSNDELLVVNIVLFLLFGEN